MTLSLESKIVCPETLAELCGAAQPIDSLGASVEALLIHQRQHWQQLAEGHAQLNNTQTRTAQIGGYPVVMQHNPARYVNVSAKVDPQSIARRACFLCWKNQSAQQQGILFKDRLLVLCNPFPIFEKHLTIVACDHTPQTIAGNWSAMLALAYELGASFRVLYNGPRCGASAPDHLHFQAGEQGKMPIEQWVQPLLEDYTQLDGVVGPGPWGYLVFSNNDPGVLADQLERTIEQLRQRTASGDHEPLFNAIAWFQSSRWVVVVFPRHQHRPACYFDTDESKQLMISPGAVDLGGLVIVVRPQDYEQITDCHLTMIFEQVAWNSDQIQTWRAEQS